MIAPKQLRILCVDDDAPVRTLIATMSRIAGHHVEVAEDGQAAAETVNTKPDAFDLIVTDTRMPRLDGIDFIKAARSGGYRGKVIVFAGNLSDEDREYCSALGVDYVIDKPAQDGELASAIRAIAAERLAANSPSGSNN